MSHRLTPKPKLSPIKCLASVQPQASLNYELTKLYLVSLIFKKLKGDSIVSNPHFFIVRSIMGLARIFFALFGLSQ